jgi:hypothetical protein
MRRFYQALDLRAGERRRIDALTAAAMATTIANSKDGAGIGPARDDAAQPDPHATILWRSPRAAR